MRENDEITGLFRSRLAGAEMTVREDFWGKLQNDLSRPAPAGAKRGFLSPKFYRVAAAASVAFVLGAASAAFWYFSPKEEIQEAFTQAAAMTPEGSLNGDVVQESFPSIHRTSPAAHKPGTKQPGKGANAGAPTHAEDESLSVHLSITFTQRVYGNNRQPENSCLTSRNSDENDANRTDANDLNLDQETEYAVASNDTSTMAKAENASKRGNRAVKIGMGTALPKGDYNMPFTVGVSVERCFNKYLSLEAGLQYNRLTGNRTLHTLAIPARMNVMLASTPKVAIYATLGGAAEKCIAGAYGNGFEAEPIQLSVAAGLGVRYRMNDRFALFAEPSVSHHFDTDSGTRTLRMERPTNLNVLCGIRMIY